MKRKRGRQFQKRSGVWLVSASPRQQAEKQRELCSTEAEWAPAPPESLQGAGHASQSRSGSPLLLTPGRRALEPGTRQEDVG